MQAILAKLNVQSNGGIWGYVLYVIMFLAVLALLLQKQSNLQLTIFMAITIIAALLDKIDAFARGDFFAFLDRVLMLVFPLVFGGMTRTSRARPWALLCGFIAAVYLFARWFFDQKP